MLQRIQSFWLLLASASTWLTLYFSVYSGVLTKDNSFHQLNAKENNLILVLTVLLGAALLIIIFLFQNRKRQMRATLLSFIASLLLLVLYYLETKNYSQGSYNLPAVFALAIPVLILLAARGIYRDGKLLKSLDRLR